MEQSIANNSSGAAIFFEDMTPQKFLEMHQEDVMNCLKDGENLKSFLEVDDESMATAWQEAYRAYNEGRTQDAIDRVWRIWLLDHFNHDYTLLLAACFQKLEKHELAINAYSLAAAIDPKDPTPHFNAGMCFAVLKNSISSRMAFEEAVRIAGANPLFSEISEQAQKMIN